MASYLEDFGPASFTSATSETAVSEAEDQRLAAFEQGYAAGWDDALEAQSKNARAASEAFAKNLQDLAFTYQEASQSMAAALNTFFEALAEQLVPDALDAGLVQRIVQRLSLHADEHLAKILIHCAPARQKFIAEAIPAQLDIPVEVRADVSMAWDEVSLEMSPSELRIDLTETSQYIRDAIAAFSFHVNQDQANG